MSEKLIVDKIVFLDVNGVLSSEEWVDKCFKNDDVCDLDPDAIPGVLVRNHGPFTWGTSPSNAVHNAAVLEEVAYMAYYAMTLNPEINNVDSYLLDKHYYRKHGKNAYYGQEKK